MNAQFRIFAATALTAAALNANAGLISTDVAYGETNAIAAEGTFMSSLKSSTTETFDGAAFSATPTMGPNDQESYVKTAPSFSTSVGTFTLTKAEDPGSDDYLPNNLMIENSDTGEFGRQDEYDSQWLDSNDAEEVEWLMSGGDSNAFGFFLSDANDVDASLELIFDDGTIETISLLDDLTNGNLMYVSAISDTAITGAKMKFANGKDTDDGWGIDDVTVGKVPEPGTLALLGLGLVGLGAARSRKA